jgi:MazG family protein
MVMIDYTCKTSTTIEEAYRQLAQITRLLRTPDGCPWDRKQTNMDYAKYLIDETYEYLDAIYSKDIENRSEELGDLLGNMTFILQIEEDMGDLDLRDTIDKESQKLVRRHPHVFTDKMDAADSDEVLKIWDEVKTKVEGRTTCERDFFSRVPSHLPFLSEAYELQKKAHKVGFDWNDAEEVYEKINEEIEETRDAADKGKEALTEEIGDLLFSVVNLARHLDVDPQIALHIANLKFRRRFNDVADGCREKNVPMDKAHMAAMDAIWNEVKKKENG